MANTAQLIRKFARMYGIDPHAALVVARGEGGLRNRQGDIGDLAGGGSFGPFQLYTQGALPARFRGNQALADRWAWSPAGIRYAIAQMAKTSARGKRGRAAVEAIIREFERPADPDASIRNALARLSQMPAAGAAAGPGGRPRRANGSNRNLARQAAVRILTQIGQGGHVDPQGLLQLAAEWKANEQGGTTIPPVDPQTGGAPSSGNKLINKVLAFAHAQIGQPYVWGGESRKEGGFDCSGLLVAAYRAAGLDLGRFTSQSALRLGRSVKGKKLRPGDMIVVNNGKHIVLYVGNGKVIAAPHQGEPVQYQDVSRFAGEIVDVRRVV